MYNCGVVEMTTRSLPYPLAGVNVLIRRHEERKEQRQTSLESRQTAHDGLSMYQVARALQARTAFLEARNCAGILVRIWLGIRAAISV